MQVFVGVDPSITNTGVVVLDTNGSTVTAFDGNEAYKHTKHKVDIARYMCQAQYIADRLREYDIQAIGYENYSYNSIHKSYSLGEYNGILKLFLYELHPLDLHLIAPLTNKKFAVGNGQAAKELVQQQAVAESPELAQRSFDITDAYFLAKYVFYRMFPDKAVHLDKGNRNLRTRLEMVIPRRRR